MDNPVSTLESFPTEIRHTVRLTSRTLLSGKAFEVELTRPASLDFIPGHNIRFVHGDIERYYSIITPPDEPKIKLLVRLVEGGIFSTHLASAAIGVEFEITGPHGYFTFKRSSRPPVFVATGTGIAPFISMALSGIQDFILLHGISHPKDLYYGSVFDRGTCRYVPCFSNSVPTEQLPSNAFQGKVTEYIRRELGGGEFDFYLCGRREMIRDVTQLVDGAFPGSLVYHEVFF